MRFLIFIFSIAIVSCSAFSIEKMGNEGEKCFSDGTCNNPFTCISGTCVDEISGSDSSQNDNAGENPDDEETDKSQTDDTSITDNELSDEDADTIEEPGCNMGETCWGAVPTQQTRCFNETAAEQCDKITSEYYGQDGLYAETINGRFENVKIGDDYYAFDHKTKLLWYKTASDTTLSHEDAKDYCNILNQHQVAEKTDWRLPYLHEMVSIVNFDEHIDPIVDGFYFPFIKTEKYWTLTNLGGNNYFYVDFSGSSQFYVEDGTTMANFAICLSSEYEYDTQRNFERFIEIPANEEVTVEDKATGLIWQKVTDYSTRIWKDALKYCQDLEFAGKDDWRLPNVNELHSLATYEKNPELQTVFPNLGDDFYWSSTTNANILGNAWIVEFKYGILKPELPKNKNENYIYTMCVRNKE